MGQKGSRDIVGKSPPPEEEITDGYDADSKVDETDRVFNRGGRKTFRKYKTMKKGSKYETLNHTLRATLGAVTDVKQAVVLPDDEDLNEWLAVNTVYFYNAASLIYGTCSEFCDEESCPVMTAGPKYEYLWADGVRIKKPMKVSAPYYITLLFDWIDEQVSDEDIFPVDDDGKFPNNFQAVVKTIFKRLFRLYGHIYWSHFDKVKELGAEAHLNSCFKHFIFFVQEFVLIDEKELRALHKLIARLTAQPTSLGSSPAASSASTAASSSSTAASASP